MKSSMCGALVGRSVAEGHIQLSEGAWYCLRSQRKREHFAAAHLRQIAGVEAFNPQLRLVRSTRRGRVWSIEPLFPNYLFARFVLEKLLEKVRYTPSVKTVVQFGERVPTIADSVIEELRQSLAESEPKVFTDEPLEGEEGEISAGPFEGEKAVVTRVLPARQRVQVLLQMMGRSVSAEFSLDTVLFQRRNAADLLLRGSETCSGTALVKKFLHGEGSVMLGGKALPPAANMAQQTIAPGAC